MLVSYRASNQRQSLRGVRVLYDRFSKSSRRFGQDTLYGIVIKTFWFNKFVKIAQTTWFWSSFPTLFQRHNTLAPLKLLLKFFKCMCRLENNTTVFVSVFTILRNKFRSFKSPPGLWTRDFAPILPRFAVSRTIQIFTAIFWVHVPTQTTSSLFGSVFTTLIIHFRWWKSPPGHAAVDSPTILQRYTTRRAVQTVNAIFWVRVPTQYQL